jgi:hypothetical protein
MTVRGARGEGKPMNAIEYEKRREAAGWLLKGSRRQPHAPKRILT